MSLETALNDEVNEVMAILEGRQHNSQQRTASERAASPGFAQSPVRSMLDVGPGPTARHSSIAGLGVGITSPTGSTFGQAQSYRSMLDTSSPPPTPGLGGPRSHRLSHGSSSPPGIPRGRGLPSPNMRPEEKYQFGMMPSIDSQAMPKRVTQGGKKKPGTMSGIFSSLDSGPRNLPEERRGSLLLKGAKSKSPAPGIHTSRSQSPGHRLNSNSSSLMTGPGKYVSNNGQVIDLNSAYRRLSDAALMKSSGSLSSLPTRKGVNLAKGEELAPDGGVRLTKDIHEDANGESTEEEESLGSSDDDEWHPDHRGRGRTRKESSGATDDNRAPKSLLAAAEEERKTYQVRSLLEPVDPTVTLTGPGGQKLSAKRGSIHPNTSFNAGQSSGVNTPLDSDEEQQRTDITTAQQMTLTLSPIHSTPTAYRCIRQILRGNYRRYQQEAEQGLRRQRMYLVATDLSEEAAYALEWTIGTVLRDGDTLLAVYAVDEEAGTGGDGPSSIGIGEGASTMKDAAAIVRTLSHQDVLTVPGEKPHGRTASDVGSAKSRERGELNAPDVKKMDKAERERYFAAEEITDRCIKLLRKTKLQVRVVVEVFHCKSPKHMITEVIDYLEPTLVILGSRGRSALKGVLLGSFSNYLVTKSSVPVMVARKKLRKHSKLKRSNLRLSNMLQTPGGSRLEMAKIDIPGKGVGKI
ncbi:hypothetical protein BLS_002749 [Venturia inaequalis]|uniref:UspA domain-containing protein n=1 Tax=Venturia inaequalis TaxID=5025 RepID=A0A8H3YVG8_VENIN|nr:hypothetical protein BLS_002749 [Venturia inaequalis]